MQFNRMDFQNTDRLIRDFPGVGVEEILDCVVREANYKLAQASLKAKVRGKKRK